MSAKVVMPPRISSAAARRVPQRTKSSVTFLASAGKMYLRSQSSRTTSSFRPRNSVIGTWVWPLMKPGRTNLPGASSCLSAMYLASISMRGPTAAMMSPLTATAPSSMIKRTESMVRTVPPVIRRSTFSFFGACAVMRGVPVESNSAVPTDIERRVAIDGPNFFTSAPEFRKGVLDIVNEEGLAAAAIAGQEDVATGTADGECEVGLPPGGASPALTTRETRCLLEIGRVERSGEELAHRNHFGLAFEVGQYDRDIATEFPD